MKKYLSLEVLPQNDFEAPEYATVVIPLNEAMVSLIELGMETTSRFNEYQLPNIKIPTEGASLHILIHAQEGWLFNEDIDERCDNFDQGWCINEKEPQAEPQKMDIWFIFGHNDFGIIVQLSEDGPVLTSANVDYADFPFII